MKKWNRALAILLAAGLAAGLCGCGNSASSPASQPPTSGSASVPPSSAVPARSEPQTPESMPVSKAEPHGLIFAHFESEKRGGEEFGPAQNKITYSVLSMEPETGKEKVISQFYYEDPSDGCYSLASSLEGPGCLSTFSEDFSKVICTKYFYNDYNIIPWTDEGSHIGWLDTEGNFFDVSEALGLEDSRRNNSIILYSPIGFSGNLFEFMGVEKREEDRYGTYKYFYVPTNHVVAEEVREGDLRVLGHPYNEDGGLIKDGRRSKYYPKDVLSWIDDTHCVVNPSNSVTIIDVETGIERRCDPERGGLTRDGVVSPDKTQIAYIGIDRQKVNDDAHAYYMKYGVYIVPVDGGEPAKVMFDSSGQLEAMSRGFDKFLLIDWI